MEYKLQPLGNRVAVRMVEEEEHTVPGGKLTILLPHAQSTYPLPAQGIVTAVGTGPECKRMDFWVGDVVYFSKHYGVEQTINGERIRFLKTHHIMGRSRETDYAKENGFAPQEKCSA